MKSFLRQPVERSEQFVLKFSVGVLTLVGDVKEKRERDRRSEGLCLKHQHQQSNCSEWKERCSRREVQGVNEEQISTGDHWKLQQPEICTFVHQN